MKNWLLIGCALLLLFGCESTSELENEISQIPVDIEVVRFDKIFGKANPSDLPRLKGEFPEFFPPQYADSIWLNRMADTLQRMQEEEVLKVFPSEEKLATDLANLFQHIKYYDPQFRVPRVYTAISDVDYRARIIPTQDYLVCLLYTSPSPRD